MKKQELHKIRNIIESLSDDNINHLEEGRYIKPKISSGGMVTYPEGAYDDVRLRDGEVAWLEDPSGYARDHGLDYPMSKRGGARLLRKKEDYDGVLLPVEHSEILCPDGYRKIFKCKVKMFGMDRYPRGAG